MSGDVGESPNNDDDEPSIKCKDGIWGLSKNSNAAAHWFELDGHPFHPLLRAACGRYASNDLTGDDIRHSNHGKCHDCMGRVISGMTTMGWKWVMSRNVVDEDRIVRHTPYGVTAAPGVYTNAKGHKIVVEYVERPKPGTAQRKSPWELVADAVGRDSIMPMRAIPVGPLMFYPDEFSTEAEAGEWLKGKLEVGPLLSIANERSEMTDKVDFEVAIAIAELREVVDNKQIELMATREEADRLMRQVDTFRKQAERKEEEIIALGRTIAYLEGRSAKPQFVNPRLNRLDETNVNVGSIHVHTDRGEVRANMGYAGEQVADPLANHLTSPAAPTNPQAGRSACATNEFSGEVGDVQRAQGDLGYDNGCGCDPQG